MRSYTHGAVCSDGSSCSSRDGDLRADHNCDGAPHSYADCSSDSNQHSIGDANACTQQNADGDGHCSPSSSTGWST